MPDSSSEAAPAKLNLALHVTGRRADGYHLLDTLVVFTQVGDTVSVLPGDDDGLTIDGRFAPSLSNSNDNLVLRARDLMRSIAEPRLAGPVALSLDKALPVASGIGGGSSDAAATLRLLRRYWSVAVEPEALSHAALALGADLPMCLAACTLRARGIGERLEPVSALNPVHVVLVNPGVAVSTPAVFGALKRMGDAGLPDAPPAGELADLVEWLRPTRNDLEAPAISIAPAIGHALDALTSSGAALARMSGSGATCFGLFGSRAEAERAARVIASAQPAWYVEATRTIERIGDAGN
jgi:4-diphosphocytidyl-2-C-methyl-D-erythritol kinase